MSFLKVARRRLSPLSIVRGLAVLAVSAILAFAGPANAANRPLAERLTPEVLAVVWPGAERLGPEEGNPPAIAVYKKRMETRTQGNAVQLVQVGEDIVGYIYSTSDVVRSPGYSVVVFDVLAGVTLDGIVTGAKVVFHEEPHIRDDAVRQPKLDTFLANHANAKIQGGNTGMLPTAYVAGATISANAMRSAIYDSARIVLHARSPRPVVTEPTLDMETFVEKSWEDLLARGSVVRKVFTNRDVAAMLEKASPGAKPEVDFGAPDDVYIELFTALATPLELGGNLIGTRDLNVYGRNWREGGHAIAVASNGRYDFLGSKYYSGAPFDRIRVVQEDRVSEFKREQFQRYAISGSGFRGQRNSAFYFIPPQAKFDALAPWRLEILVHGTGPGGPVTVALPVDYKLPAAHILMPEVEPPPAWLEAWRESETNVTIMGAALAVLTLILIFQGPLTRYRRAHRWIRNGFLAFVVVWVGWIAGAQLSIINVINYMQAPFLGFGIGFYLAEPLMVLVAVYTVVSLIVLGRGVFCGWLCPFGALQELLGQVSRALKLPQWNPSEELQRRLWMVKYVAAAAVLGIAFLRPDMAVTAAEVEPFKTAITAHFDRAWPFVIYAGALIGVGLFTERAYCRFLCPLGGTLAALDRLHLVDMLKRRPECGKPCHLCETSCPVKAIERSGKIQMAECFQCLDCQVEYYDDKRCPPLAKIRKMGQRGQSAPIGIPVAARGAAAE